MIAIIDYGVGNLASVQKAFEFIGSTAIITGDRDVILKADKVILPGVGAFSEAMKRLNESKMAEVVKLVVERDTPLLGICLGMQLLLENSTEGGVTTEGLGLIKGKVDLFPSDMDLKIPHMGWNSLRINEKSRLLKDLPSNPFVYFVHSYFCKVKQIDEVAATCQYGLSFDAAYEKNNLFATQFHPEKSGDVGIAMLRNFVNVRS